MIQAEDYKSPFKVFISYSHEDQVLRQELEKHLTRLKRSGDIIIWQDQEIIRPGDRWNVQIKNRIREAEIILLLVSASFLYSHYCWEEEVKEALKRHNAGTARVIPIILRPVDWQDPLLAELQALPTGVRPVTLWDNQDAAFEDVAKGIQNVVNDLRRGESKPILSPVSVLGKEPFLFTSPPFDQTLCRDATLADINTEAVTSFFRHERVRKEPDLHSNMTNQEMLEHFNFLQEEGRAFTYEAVLCFGRNPSKWVEGAFTRCTSWIGNDRLEGWKEDQEFRGNLLEQYESSITFLERNLRLIRVISTKGRNEHWEIPTVVLREALANALIHREYAHQTNSVRVEIYDNRVEISSPGGLLGSLTLEQLGLKDQYPLRNPHIARVFYLCNYVERYGTGIARMRKQMQKVQLPLPEFDAGDEGTFKVILRRPQHVGPLDSIFCRDASLDDVDMGAVQSLFQEERVQRQAWFDSNLTSKELLEHLNLLREGVLTYGAVLCFGRNPSGWIEGAFTRCISFKGNDRRGGWEEDQEFRVSLLGQYEAGTAFLQKNLRLSRMTTAEGSVEQWEIPLVVLREALANALIHRDYADQRNSVRVEIFDDRVEISSPGGLLSSLTIEQPGLEDQYPLRNPRIAHIFYLCNYIEMLGMGITRMQQSMKEAGLPMPQFDTNGGRTFKVILSRPQHTELHNDKATKTSTVSMTEADLWQRFEEAGRSTPHTLPFDHTFCRDASLGDVDMGVVQSLFLKERVQKQPWFDSNMIDEQLLKCLNLLHDGVLTYGAILCFGKNPSKWVAEAFTRCISYRGNDRFEGWEEDQEFRGNLLGQYEESLEFLQKNLRLSRVMSAEGSVEQWEIPLVVLREALANALIHRDYADQRNSVRVEIFDNRVEISSPGGLFSSLTVEQLGLEDQYPLRNPHIARIFYLCNYVGKLGTGIARMQQFMRGAGLPMPQLGTNGGRTFKVILSRPQHTELHNDKATKTSTVSITEVGLWQRFAEVSRSKPHTLPFDHTLCRDASLDDVDMGVVQSFFQEDRVRKQMWFGSNLTSKELLERLNLLQEGVLTYGAILCFGRNPFKWVKGAFTRCVSYKGNNRLDEWEEDQEFRGSLLGQYEESLEFLQKNLHLRHVISEGGEIEQREIPLVVLREALANALIHRDYVDQGNSVYIEIFDNRIEISNPGSLFGSLTVEQLGLEDQYPLRNPYIAHVFYLCNYVEKLGTGIARMQQFMRGAGLPAPQFDTNGGRTFKVILSRPQSADLHLIGESSLLLEGAKHDTKAESPLLLKDTKPVPKRESLFSSGRVELQPMTKPSSLSLRRMLVVKRRYQLLALMLVIILLIAMFVAISFSGIFLSAPLVHFH